MDDQDEVVAIKTFLSKTSYVLYNVNDQPIYFMHFPECEPQDVAEVLELFAGDLSQRLKERADRAKATEPNVFPKPSGSVH